MSICVEEKLVPQNVYVYITWVYCVNIYTHIDLHVCVYIHVCIYIYTYRIYNDLGIATNAQKDQCAQAFFLTHFDQKKLIIISQIEKHIIDWGANDSNWVYPSSLWPTLQKISGRPRHRYSSHQATVPRHKDAPKCWGITGSTSHQQHESLLEKCHPLLEEKITLMARWQNKELCFSLFFARVCRGTQQFWMSIYIWFFFDPPISTGCILNIS